jgi:hypothetical protein
MHLISYHIRRRFKILTMSSCYLATLSNHGHGQRNVAAIGHQFSEQALLGLLGLITVFLYKPQTQTTTMTPR